MAILAVPISGPYCPDDCIQYPYLDSLSNFPLDYIWMVPAIIQLIIVALFMISLYFIAPYVKKIYGFISVFFAFIAINILLADYFIQFTVIPISLMNGETEGLALITQYNEHGIFIALEELGYLIMACSLLSMALIFNRDQALDRFMRWLLIASFILTFIFLVYYSVRYGVDRSYRFEVVAITINWLTFIIIGILANVFFKRMMKQRHLSMQSYRP
jgi:hypothetical protein